MTPGQTFSMIFCRISSEIQSAVCTLNLTSAFVLTIKIKIEEKNVYNILFTDNTDMIDIAFCNITVQI